MGRPHAKTTPGTLNNKSRARWCHVQFEVASSTAYTSTTDADPLHFSSHCPLLCSALLCLYCHVAITIITRAQPRRTSTSGEMTSATAPPAPGHGLRVAVVGSGLAGLTTAYLLRQRGVTVFLIEKVRPSFGLPSSYCLLTRGDLVREAGLSLVIYRYPHSRPRQGR